MDIPVRIPARPEKVNTKNTYNGYRATVSVAGTPDPVYRTEAAHYALQHAIQVAAFLALDADPGFYPRLVVILAELERTIADHELQDGRRS
jgi:hypothetical protein